VTVYCTYFDRHYLARGLTLYKSLVRHLPGVELRALCLDDETFAVLSELAWPGLRPVALAELERADPVFHATKSDRTRLEYYFTCTPAWTSYALRYVAPGDFIAYVDADLCFYSNPAAIFDEIGSASVAITPHRFPESDREFEMFGVYNVGFLAFRNDIRARAVLADWRSRCIEWCYDNLEEDRFAEQKYLDPWPSRFPGVHVVDNPGAGLAPWNLTGHTIDPAADPPTVNGVPLIFYHYHAFRSLGKWLYDTGLGPRMISRSLHEKLYARYAGEVRDSIRAADTIAPGVAREIPHRRSGVYEYYTALLKGLLFRRSSLHVTPSPRR
jgi:hypothetical protein